MRTPIAALVAALLLTSPLAASAQDAPSYADQGDGGNGGDAQIRGRIAAFDGAYSLQVRDDRGYTDNVQLHPGTIINPTGITLAPGMVVSILGYNDGSWFAANEVDTPYTYYSGTPYYQGHPWSYYGPSVGLTFFFGNTNWWHGSAFYGGGYHYNAGVRVYNNNVHVNTVYHGGSYQGRTYAAPPERGGYYPSHTQSAHSGSYGNTNAHGNGNGGNHGNDHH